MQFLWRPYVPYIDNNIIPLYLLQESDQWRMVCPLICFETIEWHQVDRVMRQFGLAQPIPMEPQNLGRSHNIDLRGRKGRLNWSDIHGEWINFWANRNENSMIQGIEIQDFNSSQEYSLWYSQFAFNWLYLTQEMIQQNNQEVGNDEDNDDDDNDDGDQEEPPHSPIWPCPEQQQRSSDDSGWNPWSNMGGSSHLLSGLDLNYNYDIAQSSQYGADTAMSIAAGTYQPDMSSIQPQDEDQDKDGDGDDDDDDDDDGDEQPQRRRDPDGGLRQQTHPPRRHTFSPFQRWRRRK